MTGQEPERLAPLLMQVAKLLRDRVHARMEGIELGRGQGLILARLGDADGIPQTELARRTFVRPATLTEALQRMESGGLIVRRTDPADQRVSRVYLTGKGRAACAQVEAVLQEVEDDLRRILTADDRAKLAHLLEKLRAGLGGESP